jgi:AI-2 transport protein TqsA
MSSEEMKRYEKTEAICLILIAAVSIGFALHWARPILIPFAVSLMVAITLAPLVGLLQNRARLPRIPAVVISLLLGIAVLLGLGLLVWLSLGDLQENLDVYAANAQASVERFLGKLPLERMGTSQEETLTKIQETAGTTARSVLMGIAAAIGEILGRGLLVLIFISFLMLGGVGRPVPAGTLWGKIQYDVKRYMLVKVINSMMTGLIVGALLWLIGVPFALMFGVLTFLLNFIPSIGSIIATILPIPVVLMSPEMSMWQLALAVLLPGAVQVTIGNILEPRMLGKALGLHPIAVLLALIFWGVLWGTVGMFLAAPLTAVARILLEKHELTAPAARVMAGQFNAPPARPEASASRD